MPDDLSSKTLKLKWADVRVSTSGDMTTMIWRTNVMCTCRQMFIIHQQKVTSVMTVDMLWASHCGETISHRDFWLTLVTNTVELAGLQARPL
jgi:hypothetical protein